MRAEVQIDLMDPTGVTLNGYLQMPNEPRALVILVYAGRQNPDHQNIYLSRVLNRRSIATLFIGLLTPIENAGIEDVINTSLLGDRLVQVTQWTIQQTWFKSLPVGYFGNGDGAAPALKAAALLGDTIKAIVSVGGHPELAKYALSTLKAPLQMIVGSKDTHSVYLNQIAYDQLRNQKKLIIVKDASPSFEELGTWKKVVRLTADWMEEYLVWPVQFNPVSANWVISQ